MYTYQTSGSGATAGGSAGHKVPGPSIRYTTPHGKRVRDEDVVDSLHRRQRLDTPTKHDIGCLQPVASPIVAVRDT